ncbi:hypothetical protein DRJ25_05875, partial [Candidatus Woesearchaeota archaeon]
SRSNHSYIVFWLVNFYFNTHAPSFYPMIKFFYKLLNLLEYKKSSFKYIRLIKSIGYIKMIFE